MITKITIHNYASYNKKIIIKPNKVNFMFGANSAGKTSFSEFLRLNPRGESEDIQFQKELEKIFVYNSEYRKENFGDNYDMDGVFVFGKEHINLRKKILQRQQENSEYERIKTIEINNRYNENEQIINKSKLELHNSVLEFRDNVLKEINEIVQKYSEANDSSSLTEFRTKYSEIEEKKHYLYKKWVKLFKSTKCDETKFIYEYFPVFETKILAKLEKTFTKYLNKKNNDFKKNIKLNPEETAIENFRQKSDIMILIDMYKNEAEKLYKSFSLKQTSLISSKKNNKIIEEIDNFLENYNHNIKNLEEIHDNQLFDFKIIDTVKILSKINNKSKVINREITKHNSKIYERNSEEEFFLNFSFMNYESKIKEFGEIEDQLLKKWWNNFDNKTDELSKYYWEVELQEKHILSLFNSIPSVSSLIDKINKSLNKYNFKDFKLIENKEKIGISLIRKDGSEAKKNLSESEYNFLTFLYFYHTITEDKNIEKIVVIDDPVSSLDDSITFVVSSLITKMIKECCSEVNENKISQIFVLTHNYHFYRNLTRHFETTKKEKKLFFVVQKEEGGSNIYTYKTNPVKSVYLILWKELKNSKFSDFSTAHLNVMRKIIEYYFYTIWMMSKQDLIETAKLNGFDAEPFLQLISEGSHLYDDGLAVSIKPGEVEKQKDQFKRFFKALGHEVYYETMMNQVENEND